jgi:uncharacterized protein YprB with RNaseH-like and TPR domain
LAFFIKHMTSLREKLYQIDSTLSHQGQYNYSDERVEIKCKDTLGGKVEETEHGTCLALETSYPLLYQHGHSSLEVLLSKTGQDISLAAKSVEFNTVNPSRLLFIDTETTGLAGGTGTYLFLVGVGYFKENCFCVLQYLMRDFDEEKAMLYLISQLSHNFDAVVSYNGKTFDMALFRTRCVLARIENHLDTLRHLDLVHTSRRLWKRRLPDCTLSSVEKDIIGFSRPSDIPGYLIPSVYFEYLRSRQVTVLRNVLRHNVWDVLSLVSITNAACEVFLTDGKNEPTYRDPLGVIRTYEDLGQYDRAVEVCEQEAARSADGLEAKQYHLKRALYFKREKRWDEAEQAFQTAIRIGRFHPLPYVELAKIYEHQRRDLKAAKKYIDQALESLSVVYELGGNQNFNEYHSDLHHRKQRITRKLQKQETVKS